MRLVIATILIAALALTTSAAAPKDKAPDPTFKPGAEVNIELTVKAPKGWHINYMLPLQVIFDKKLLKDAPFTVAEPTLSFTLKEYVNETVLEIPVKLSKQAKAGELTIPFAIDYSICEEESDQCTFGLQNVKVPLQVELTAPAGTKDRALAAGDLPTAYQLPPAIS